MTKRIYQGFYCCFLMSWVKPFASPFTSFLLKFWPISQFVSHFIYTHLFRSAHIFFFGLTSELCDHHTTLTFVVIELPWTTLSLAGSWGSSSIWRSYNDFLLTEWLSSPYWNRGCFTGDNETVLAASPNLSQDFWLLLSDQFVHFRPEFVYLQDKKLLKFSLSFQSGMMVELCHVYTGI